MITKLWKVRRKHRLTDNLALRAVNYKYPAPLGDLQLVGQRDHDLNSASRSERE